MASLAVSTSLFVKCARACSGIILTPVRFRQKGFVRRPQKVIYPKPEAEVSPSLNTEPLGEPVGEPRYVKLGSDDDEFANTMMLLKVKRKREKLNKVLLEGRRLIGDALKAGVECETIYFTLPENLEGLPLETLREDQIKKVFYKKMKIWSDLTTSPGIMGTAIGVCK